MVEQEQHIRGSVELLTAVPADAPLILELIKSAPDALLDLSLEEIQGWITEGRSLVAKTIDGKLVGHQGMYYWPKSNTVEVRSAFVKPEFRGQGINTQMKEIVMEKAKNDYPGSYLVGFTEAASKSRGILAKMGFSEISMDDVPKEYFTICPQDVCFKKTGKDCGCKVFVRR